MIECIFTIDYEIYGNGCGALRELVFEPARRLNDLFVRAGSKFVVFVEAAELEKIEVNGTDPAINDVKNQVKEFYQHGHEVALHLHPQWFNACYRDEKWELDFGEYNLCILPENRISEIIERSITYLRTTLEASNFTTISFRAGNWLFQPTRTAAKVLAAHGVRIDSSVFKGGRQYQHRLDYRSAARNGYFWKFEDDVNITDPNGILLEIPIYTQIVPFWKMITAKRIGLQQKASSSKKTVKGKLYRFLDIARFRQPLKLDFCRMTIEEMSGMINRVIQDDQYNPKSYKPIVAIGHTKDLIDFDTVDLFLSYLRQRGIKVSTLKEAYEMVTKENH